MALLDQTVPTVRIRKPRVAHILRRFRGVLALKHDLETYRIAEEQRERARRKVDDLLKSCGPRHLG